MKYTYTHCNFPCRRTDLSIWKFVHWVWNFTVIPSCCKSFPKSRPFPCAKVQCITLPGWQVLIDSTTEKLHKWLGPIRTHWARNALSHKPSLVCQKRACAKATKSTRWGLGSAHERRTCIFIRGDKRWRIFSFVKKEKKKTSKGEKRKWNYFILVRMITRRLERMLFVRGS